MLIDEIEVCAEIAKELKLPIKDVIALTTTYKQEVANGIKEQKKQGYTDMEFKILLPRFCTFKRKIFKNENSGVN